MIKPVKDFKDGDSLVQPLLVTQLVKGVTSNGAPYLSMTLQDNSASIEAKMWDVKEEILNQAESGKVYEFRFDVLKYRTALQLRINEMHVMNQEDINIRDYVISAPIPLELLKSKIHDAVYSIENPIYRSILMKLFTEYQNEFFDYPAASKNHHNFIGGLAMHVTGMVDVANDICQLYPFLNRDLLISGVLIHDIGKITELSGSVATEYTLQGKLLGHISIMQAKLYDLAKELGYEESEEVTLLRHMVLSHHGKLEFGSPVMPMLMEAEVLSLIDNLDARLNTLSNALAQTEEGQFTSRLFALENRAFYKPKMK